MKKTKLKYSFHNPNTAEVTADYILKVMIEVNAPKVERALESMAKQLEQKKENDIEHSA